MILALPFATGDEVEPTAEEKTAAIREYFLGSSTQERATAYLDVMSQASDEYVEAVVAQQMADMTRESIEQMIVSQYAAEMGVDEETITSYIAEMDDETLFARVEEAMAAAVREQYAQATRAQMASMTAEEMAEAFNMSFFEIIGTVYAAGPEDIANMDPTAIATRPDGSTWAMFRPTVTPFEAWQFVYLYDNYMPPTLSQSTYEDNLDLLGYVDLESPSAISIYASTFSDKDKIADLISEYNAGVESDDEITYTDYVALLMSSITNIISGISYLLIAFVSISLVVSSIMIGIITYISVLERTKEIGILRAVGASKKDVSRVFNAETFIVGLGAGVIGIGVTLLLTIPINIVLRNVTGIVGLKSVLPVAGAVILVAISAFLTIIAGLIPAKVAANKDPVVALRTE